VALAGCGGGLAPVTGKVTYKNEPVKGGILFFNPIPASEGGAAGRPAVAEVQADGTYTLMTEDSPGALIGKHRVTFNPPEQKLTDEQKTDTKTKVPPPPYMGLTPKVAEVEVKSGANAINIELVPAPPKPKIGSTGTYGKG